MPIAAAAPCGPTPPRTPAVASSSASICATSFLRCELRASTLCSARPAIPLRWLELLTGLCTNVVPHDVGDVVPRSNSSIYAAAHLPQGAPTSPALANLCAYRLDCRLAALAASLAATYTRYADDLAFSGGEELERGARRFQVLVCRVALEEGFEVHTRKSRFMRQAVRQQLAGVVVNEHPNVQRGRL